MSVMCRICMITDFKGGSRIYDSIERNVPISEQIMSICNVSMSMEDGMPDLICLDCYHELQTALTFKSKCEKTDDFLRCISITKSNIVDIEFGDNIKNDLKINLKEEPIYSENEVSEPYYLENETSPAKLIQKKYNVMLSNYKCAECGIIFLKKLERSNHMKVHIYTCNDCKRQFKNKSTLEKHFRLRNKDCLDISTDDNIHIRGVGTHRTFCCTICEHTTKRIRELKSHILIHTGLKPFQCNLCLNSYTQFGSLHYHKIKIHKLKTKLVICEICGKNMPTKQQLYKHLQTHSDKKFDCKICNAQLKSKSILQLHMKRHMGVKNFNCEQCGATFFTQAELCNHRKTHLDSARLFPCPACDFRAKKKSALKSHYEKHSKEKPFSCNICGRFFITAQRLCVHKSIIHNTERSKEKKLQCPTCSTTFNHMKSLRRHVINHHSPKDISEDIKIPLGLQTLNKP